MDARTLETRFHDTCTALGSTAGLMQRNAAWVSLVGRYSEPHRAYHTLEHLCEVFDMLETLGVTPASEPALWFALFYHDAIYDVGPDVRDNEEKSLVLARNAAQHLGCLQVRDLDELILLTKHHAPQTDPIRQLCADVDLGIFGAARERYMAQIRHEYAWVPEGVYREHRAEFLQRFLDERPFIYGRPAIHDHRERQARENLMFEIAQLRG